MKSEHTSEQILTAMKAWGFSTIASCLSTGAAADVKLYGVAVAFGLFCIFSGFAFLVCTAMEGKDD